MKAEGQMYREGVFSGDRYRFQSVSLSIPENFLVKSCP